MTIDEALALGQAQLSHSPTPALDARLLLQHVLQQPTSTLLAHGERRLSRAQLSTWQGLLQRAAQGEPIPYLTGSAPFFDFDLSVTHDVLIPRPETEQLVEMAVSWARTHGVQHVIDVGTGSGCVAIALARQLPDVAVTAVDTSSAALAIARQNGAVLAPGRVDWTLGDLLMPLAGPVELVVANLPYITEDEWTGLDDGVKLYEPAVALKGGSDGLEVVKRLLQQARPKVAVSSAIFLEIGWRQGDTAVALAHQLMPEAAVALKQDFAGHDRFLSIVTA